MRIPGLVRTAAILALCPISLGHAQSPADFYKGKTIDLFIEPLFVGCDHARP